MNFWQKLSNKKKPFFVLAPMADVTDAVFRQVVIKTGKPDVFYTEFTSVDGLCSNIGRRRLIKNLRFSKNEKPIVAQFFGTKPENFYVCAKLAKKLGFDGIDINMGCPDKKVERQGAGAKLILNPKLAREIIEATKRGAGALPVSVKTRIGFNEVITVKWIKEIIKAKPDAVIVHGRTRKELSLVPADWREIGKAAKIVKKAGIIAIGNGDVYSLDDGKNKAKKYGLDGIMIGRGIFQNPWIFNPKINLKDVEPNVRIKLAIYHIKLFKRFWKDTRNYDNLKKFYKIYISGWPACASRPSAKSLRTKLMNTSNIAEALSILTSA
jgi:tRNA-dihydrouridine synthase